MSVGSYDLAGHGGLVIDDAVIIGGHCYFTVADHRYGAYRFQGETAVGIWIGRGAWFGARCVVLDGVTVGEGCVIGAGAVVTKNLRGNMVCLGAPCREIRCREESGNVDWQ